MAVRMDLLGVCPTMANRDTLAAMLPEQQRAASHAAWGTYVWLTFRTFFYADRGIPHPPMYPIPPSRVLDPIVDAARTSSQQRSSMQPGNLFVALCHLCLVAQNVACAYFDGSKDPVVQRVPVEFAETKYRELLGWVQKLPHCLTREDESRADVLPLQ